MTRSTRLVILIKIIYTLWGPETHPSACYIPYILYGVGNVSFTALQTQTDMARSTRLVILIKNTLYGVGNAFLLPITNFLTNLVYPFTLRVTILPVTYCPTNLVYPFTLILSDESSIPFYSTSNGSKKPKSMQFFLILALIMYVIYQSK